MNRPVRPVRIDLSAARLLLCGYGLFALVGARLPSPRCPYRRLTGRRCPACGLTGSVAAALRGRIRHAAAIHPLGPAVAAAAVTAGIATVVATARS